jgi:hypothetical protein
MPVHVLDIGPLGPLVTVGLAVGDPFAAAGLGGPSQSRNALIDTGSTITAISPDVRSSLQPQRVGRLPVHRPGAVPVFRPLFDARLKLDGHLKPGRWFALEVVEATPATPGVDMLVGRDLLHQLTMLYNGPLGKLVLMY